MRRKWGAKMGDERAPQKVPVLYARREPSNDPDLPPRTFAKDVVLSLTPDFRKEAARYRWNDPARPTRAPRNGAVRVTVDGESYRIAWADDVPGDWEK